ncbi:MAG TPA: two-component sensor histidine kinase, partial [Anaeromyxobacteraceae bacterium]|nr:two-component sensor histidine kinase [Anaeromyxobacteraceae bacterium]
MALFGPKRIDEVIRALEAERESGVRAELPDEVARLSELLWARARGSAAGNAPPAEWRALVAALPDAAGVVDEHDTVVAANAGLDALVPAGRAAGLTLLEAVRTPELADAVRAAREGVPRR